MPENRKYLGKVSSYGLQGEWVWVIGGAGYLGQAVVEGLCQQDANVLCTDLSERAFAFHKESELGDQLIPATFDLADTDNIAPFVAEFVDTYGVPGGLVNMAYAVSGRSFEQLESEGFDRVNRIAITAGFLLGREIGSQMAANGGGSLLMVGSRYGSVVPDPSLYRSPMLPNPVEYGVSKAATIPICRYLAMQFGPQKVRFNCISPGPFPNLEVGEEKSGIYNKARKENLSTKNWTCQ